MTGSVLGGKNAKVNNIEKRASHKENLINNCSTAFIIQLILSCSGPQM